MTNQKLQAFNNSQPTFISKRYFQPISLRGDRILKIFLSDFIHCFISISLTYTDDKSSIRIVLS